MRPVGIANYYPIDHRTFDAQNNRWELGITNFKDRNMQTYIFSSGNNANGAFGIQRALNNSIEANADDASTPGAAAEFKSSDGNQLTFPNNAEFPGDVQTTHVPTIRYDGDGTGTFKIYGAAPLMYTLDSADGTNLPRYKFRQPWTEVDGAPGSHDVMDKGMKIDVFMMRPHMVLMMNSAIYCNNPGADCGRMMRGYPHTGVAVDQTTEELIITMRM